MQKRIRIIFLVTLFLTLFFFALSGCNNRRENAKTEFEQLSGFEENSYINYRSFQNPDKTWGFTIFVNSMPYRHYSRIPYKDYPGGFVSRKEADAVASLFIRFLKEGNSSPRLNRKIIDTLGITIK
jgi:hypothetical protein